VTAARIVLAALVCLPFLRVKGLSTQRTLMFAVIARALGLNGLAGTHA
jgi:hypothetical protein